MQARQMVRDLVLTAVTRIESSPKNRTNELLWKALGAVGMAAELSAISYEDADIAQKHLNASASWRGVCNFPDFGRWEVEALEACHEFQRVWG